MYRGITVFLSICFVFGVFGCGSGGTPKPKLYPVKGRVTLKGKPLTGCTLVLVAIKTVPGASDVYIGVLNENGEFELASGNGKAGAALGTYKVTFTGAEGSGQLGGESMMEAIKNGTAGKKAKDPPYPREYESAKTSKRDVEITAESNELLIPL